MGSVSFNADIAEPLQLKPNCFHTRVSHVETDWKGTNGGRLLRAEGLYLNVYSFHSLPSTLPSMMISQRNFVM